MGTGDIFITEVNFTVPNAKVLEEKKAIVAALAEKMKNADIIISAVGKSKFIHNAEHIKSGAIIIDVGINRDTNGKLCGDADYDALVDKCEYLTPVPGGIGLLTRAMLLKNTLTAFKNSIS